MRILWHSHSPLVTTGYGTPTALWLPELVKMGHDVTASAFIGQAADCRYQGVQVVNTDDGKLGATRLADLAARARADAIITLMDVWVYPPEIIDSLGIPAFNWFPVDTDPLSILDEDYFRKSKAMPVPMSEYGVTALAAAGLQGAGIPYAFDPAVFYPDEPDRDRSRREMGLDGKFVIGINAANVTRKAWPEQLSGYARLWREHPGDVILLVNSGNGEVDLNAILMRLGLPGDAIRWSRSADFPASGTSMSQAALARLYRCLDVLLACTYAEGFCLPVAEAQACGCPVIVTDAPPVSSEAGLLGQHVRCEPVWNPGHRAWWHRPSIAGIHEALEEAFARKERDTPAITGYIRKYAISEVAPLWAAALDQVRG